MSDMIEAVARAIDPEGWAYHEVYLKIKEADAKMAKDLRDRSIRIQRSLRNARAAIEAMREMTDEMVEAFAEAGFDAREAAREENRRRKLHNPSAIAECQWVPQAFRAAIDAALSQDTHSLPSEDR